MCFTWSKVTIIESCDGGAEALEASTLLPEGLDLTRARSGLSSYISARVALTFGLLKTDQYKPKKLYVNLLTTHAL